MGKGIQKAISPGPKKRRGSFPRIRLSLEKKKRKGRKILDMIKIEEERSNVGGKKG